MIGCVGKEGYVLVPRLVQDHGNNQVYSKFYGVPVDLWGKFRPVFDPEGLPRVGDVVTLSDLAPLLDKQEIQEKIDDLALFWSGVPSKAKVLAMKPNIDGERRFSYYYFDEHNAGYWNYPMTDGARVKILGYEKIQPENGGEYLLFAKVLVVFDNTGYEKD